jgi:subtilisin family serine protease
LYYGTDQKAYLNTVRMPQAWDLSKSTGDQIVAVLDTGVDAGHPDLVGHLVPGYNADVDDPAETRSTTTATAP